MSSSFNSPTMIESRMNGSAPHDDVKDLPHSKSDESLPTVIKSEPESESEASSSPSPPLLPLSHTTHRSTSIPDSPISPVFISSQSDSSHSEESHLHYTSQRIYPQSPVPGFTRSSDGSISVSGSGFGSSFGSNEETNMDMDMGMETDNYSSSSDNEVYDGELFSSSSEDENEPEAKKREKLDSGIYRGMAGIRIHHCEEEYKSRFGGGAGGGSGAGMSLGYIAGVFPLPPIRTRVKVEEGISHHDRHQIPAQQNSLFPRQYHQTQQHGHYQHLHQQSQHYEQRQFIRRSDGKVFVFQRKVAGPGIVGAAAGAGEMRLSAGMTSVGPMRAAAGIRIAHHHHHHRSRSLPEDVGHGRYEVCEEGVRAGHGTAPRLATNAFGTFGQSLPIMHFKRSPPSSSHPYRPSSPIRHHLQFQSQSRPLSGPRPTHTHSRQSSSSSSASSSSSGSNRRLLLVGPAVAQHLRNGGSVRVRDMEGAVIGMLA